MSCGGVIYFPGRAKLLLSRLRSFLFMFSMLCRVVDKPVFGLSPTIFISTSMNSLLALRNKPLCDFRPE